MTRAGKGVVGLEHLAYRPDIDGLRALAVLGVLLYHAFPTLLPGGFAGVDVFFVISGYLITALILQDFGRGGFSIWRFYERRIRRIFPALLAMLAVVWVLGYALLMPGELKALGQSMVRSAYFSNNFLLYGQAGYFDADAELKPLLHLWSLAVEEQFYIAWPWLLWLAIRLRSYGKLIPLGLGALSLVACVLVTPRDQAAAFFLPHYRAWELLAGAVVAIYGRDLRHVLAAKMMFCVQWLGLLGFLLIVGTYFWVSGAQPFPGWRAIIPVLGATLIILAEPSSWFARRCLSAWPVVAIGLISYPLYLWHWPLFSFARILYGSPSVGMLLGLILASVLLAWASYRYLETPVRRSSIPFLRASSLPIVGLALLVSLGVLGDRTRTAKGFPGRVNGDAWQSLDWPASRIIDTDCLAQLKPRGDYCQRSRQGPVTHVLLGDSHANHFFPGLAAVVAGDRGNLLQIQGPLDMAPGGLWSNVEWLNLQTQASVVFVAYHHGRLYQKDNPFAGAVEQMLNQLFAAGKQVIFVIDNPEFSFEPRLCTDWPVAAQWLGAGNNAAELCKDSLEYVRRKRTDYDTFVAKLAVKYPKLQFINAFSNFCDEKQCSPINGKDLLFRDRHHLTESGSARAFSGLVLPPPGL